MALRSERQDSKVDPDNGVYVEMEGIMEVRYSSEDVDYENIPEDFLAFQARVREIPHDFCQKNKETTAQAEFYCLVCNCPMKSLRPLRDHVTGTKHIKKACVKKRQMLGLPMEPQNAPRIKKLKKERPWVDVGLTLAQRLQECGEPAIGLEYITEYTNPRKPADHPMYTCSLEGCKSAWGTSDDIFNHCIRTKHHKNFFKKLNPEDNRIAGLTNADILKEAAEYEDEQGGSEKRDYEVINIVRDYEKYVELRDRPDDWSEKKARLGLVRAAFNSNMEPMGMRGDSRGWEDRKKQQEEVPAKFDEEDWAGWQPPSKKQRMEEFSYNFRNGIKDVEDMVEEFDGKKGSEKYEEIVFYKKMYGDLLSLFDNDFQYEEGRKERDLVRNLKGELGTANDHLEEKVEKEDRSMKGVSKLMAELEEEIETYASERDTKKYSNIQSRLSHITKEMKVMQPTSPANTALRAKYNERLTQLWKDFESRSDSLVEVLQQQMEGAVEETRGKTNSQKKLQARNDAIENYRVEITEVVKQFLQQFIEKFQDQKELCAFAVWVVDSKVLDQEVNVFTERGSSWSEFHLTPKTRNQVEIYLRGKMEKYYKGEVFKRQK